jgi:hypothetical protein
MNPSYSHAHFLYQSHSWCDSTNSGIARNKYISAQHAAINSP